MRALEAGSLPLEPQPAEGVVHAAKIGKDDATIDWSLTARAIVDHVRAFDPAPGCVAELERAPGVTLKVWRARIAPPEAAPEAAPGTVLSAGADGVVVACGDGAVALLELQRPGGRRMPAREFLAGFPIRAGGRSRSPAASA